MSKGSYNGGSTVVGPNSDFLGGQGKRRFGSTSRVKSAKDKAFAEAAAKIERLRKARSPKV